MGSIYACECEVLFTVPQTTCRFAALVPSSSSPLFFFHVCAQPPTSQGGHKTYYHAKDIEFLARERLLTTFREQVHTHARSESPANQSGPRMCVGGAFARPFSLTLPRSSLSFFSGIPARARKAAGEGAGQGCHRGASAPPRCPRPRVHSRSPRPRGESFAPVRLPHFHFPHTIEFLLSRS